MRFTLTLLAATLWGCGAGPADETAARAPREPVGAAETSQTNEAARTIAANGTRYVEQLPSYPSVPLPDGLTWETNLDDPPFASPDAKRGGAFRYFIDSFPLTLRPVGPDANATFALYLRGMNAGLTGLHPNTLRPIPQLATHWAFDADGKTVYYQLDATARWSDGLPVTADDFVFTLEFMRSPHIVAPLDTDYYTNVVVDIRKHDDHTISITGAAPKPREEMLVEYFIQPTPRQFHKLDERWVEDYNWRIPPVTGAYRISGIERGEYVEFSRVADWWGDDNKYYANRYNPDTLRFTVIRDMNVAWEYFLRGELDSFPLSVPTFWHEKAQGAPFGDGYIHKIKSHVDKPQPAMGLWLNMDDPLLADRDVRLGLHHSMNFDLMLSGLLRGDYERLRQAYDGYGDYSNPNIAPRSFDLDAAEEYFAAAGWQLRGPDGIRVKDGRQLALSIVYPQQEHTARLVVLREEARKAGVDLNIELRDASAFVKQILEKQHQIAWMAWSVNPFPVFWEMYHSENAHKPQTNNITNTDDVELDALIIEQRDATDRATRVNLAHEIEQRLYDMAHFIPAYKVTYAREAHWRWLELPEPPGTRNVGSLNLLFDPLNERNLADGRFWIDEAAKDETLAARAAGRTFEPVLEEDRTWRVD